MTREDYIQYRNKNDIYPMYYFYIQYRPKKEEEPLEIQDFLKLIQLWPFGQQAYEDVLTYYDHMFEVSKLENLKTRQIIKFL